MCLFMCLLLLVTGYVLICMFITITHIDICVKYTPIYIHIHIHIHVYIYRYVYMYIQTWRRYRAEPQRRGDRHILVNSLYEFCGCVCRHIGVEDDHFVSDYVTRRQPQQSEEPRGREHPVCVCVCVCVCFCVCLCVCV